MPRSPCFLQQSQMMLGCRMPEGGAGSASVCAAQPPPRGARARTHRSGRCRRAAGHARPGILRGSWYGCRGPTARLRCGRELRGCRGGRAPPPCPLRLHRCPAGPTSSPRRAPRACPPARQPAGLGPWWAGLGCSGTCRQKAPSGSRWIQEDCQGELSREGRRARATALGQGETW